MVGVEIFQGEAFLGTFFWIFLVDISSKVFLPFSNLEIFDKALSND